MAVEDGHPPQTMESMAEASWRLLETGPNDQSLSIRLGGDLGRASIRLRWHLPRLVLGWLADGRPIQDSQYQRLLDAVNRLDCVGHRIHSGAHIRGRSDV